MCGTENTDNLFSCTTFFRAIIIFVIQNRNNSNSKTLSHKHINYAFCELLHNKAIPNGNIHKIHNTSCSQDLSTCAVCSTGFQNSVIPLTNTNTVLQKQLVLPVTQTAHNVPLF